MFTNVYITMLVFGEIFFSDVATYTSTFPQKKYYIGIITWKKIHPYEKPSQQAGGYRIGF